MEIRELRAFTAAAEEGSLSAAARRLHLSQSALSQTIRSLERQLGVQLLDRDSAGVTVTEAGSVLLREARVLLDQHERALAAVTGQAAAGPAILRVGVPLELPGDLLPRALAEVAAAFPDTRVEIGHASSAAQLAALRAGDLDVALARECLADSGYDAVLAAEESLGVLLDAGIANKLAGPGGVRLHQLAALEWTGFSRAEAPAWHDQVTATLRGHGIVVRERPERTGEGGLIAEVKLAAVATGKVFALAPPGWTTPLPDGITWCPLVGNPLVRRTWAVWLAAARRRDLAAFVAALDAAMPGPAAQARRPAPVS
jgi:DNA-binding transcriptional LysR family regulator